MKALLSTWALTLGILVLTSGLSGATGSYYLVTTAGLPHFILAFVFALVAARHGHPRRRRALAWLGALSLVACAVYARFPFFDVVGAYFVIHMFRDEVHMFLNRRAGFDPQAVAEAHQRPELMPVWITGRIFMVVALAAYLLGRLAVMNRAPRQSAMLADSSLQLTGSVPLDLLIGGGLALALGVLALLPRRGFTALHLPLATRDFLALFLTVALVAHLREATLFLALYHYVSWYLFYGEKLRARTARERTPGQGQPFWARVMTHPRPFATLMTVANAASAIVLALYLWRPEHLGFLAAGYEYAYFPYWTIPHVTLSFMPRR